MFLVMAIKKSIKIEAFGHEQDVSFESAGFFGMLPVFSKREDAEKWANGSQVVEIEIKEPRP